MRAPKFEGRTARLADGRRQEALPGCLAGYLAHRAARCLEQGQEVPLAQGVAEGEAGRAAGAVAECEHDPGHEAGAHSRPERRPDS